MWGSATTFASAPSFAPLPCAPRCISKRRGRNFTRISLGKTLESAFALGVEVETLSRLYTQVLTLGEPTILSDEEMARVIEQMRKMSYGQAPDAEGINDLARPRTGTAA